MNATTPAPETVAVAAIQTPGLPSGMELRLRHRERPLTTARPTVTPPAEKPHSVALRLPLGIPSSEFLDMGNTKLVLNDGTVFEGCLFGSSRAVCGEVVFNTGMTGYVETLDGPFLRRPDPGADLSAGRELWRAGATRGEGRLRRPYESDRIQVQGLVVQHYVDEYSHHAAARIAAPMAAGRGRPWRDGRGHPRPDSAAARARDDAGMGVSRRDDARRSESACARRSTCSRRSSIAWRQPSP